MAGMCETLIQSQQGRLQWEGIGHGGTIWPEKFWEKVATAPLVVLDEIGCREKVSDANYEAVRRCIDERYSKPFVCISNLELADVSRLYDARVVSRLAAGTVVSVEGSDRRIQP